jgi:hypothetical protein
MNSEYASYYADMLRSALLEVIRDGSDRLSPNDYMKANKYAIKSLEVMRENLKIKETYCKYNIEDIDREQKFLKKCIDRLKM